jgi:hypothetical protein
MATESFKLAWQNNSDVSDIYLSDSLLVHIRSVGV